mmetsp:Transcript_22593/g.45386  ORF Transcript_22593/g.45386 Transcript_22593/m.45386 type:complete len:293 (+) Transcript_22593:623-1501(+)
MIPPAHMSTRLSSGAPSKDSGAGYHSVYSFFRRATQDLAFEKSASSMLELESTRMFSGLRLLWTTLAEWMNLRPHRSWYVIFSGFNRWPPASKTSASEEGDGRILNAMLNVLCASQMSCNFTMFLHVLKCFRILISSRRWRRLSTLSRGCEMSLIATAALVSRSSANATLPYGGMFPTSVTQYRPSTVSECPAISSSLKFRFVISGGFFLSEFIRTLFGTPVCSFSTAWQSRTSSSSVGYDRTTLSLRVSLKKLLGSSLSVSILTWTILSTASVWIPIARQPGFLRLSRSIP